MAITPPDIAITIIIGFFAFNGLRHGFIEEIGRLISLASGFIMASKFHHIIIPHINPYIETETLQITLAYLIVFLTTIIKSRTDCPKFMNMRIIALRPWVYSMKGNL